MEALHPYAPREESLALVEKAAAIARDVAAPSAEDVDRRGRFPREALAALAEAGFYGLGVAPDAGGVGVDMRTLCAVVEVLAEACASTAMIFVMHALAVRAIAASETLGGKDALLREIASGRTLATLAYSEETSRSNFWIQGSALQPHADGGYRLDALKTWVTSAGHAQLYVAAARSPGATSGTEFTVFLARHAPTSEVLGSYDGLGLRGNASCKVRFHEHRIAGADLLSEHGRGRSSGMRWRTAKRRRPRPRWRSSGRAGRRSTRPST
jgi:alkylation response protein AidB-like acyl-CoA dehydrogenase